MNGPDSAWLTLAMVPGWAGRLPRDHVFRVHRMRVPRKQIALHRTDDAKK
jgi:hypothetical protein